MKSFEMYYEELKISKPDEQKFNLLKQKRKAEAELYIAEKRNTSYLLPVMVAIFSMILSNFEFMKSSSLVLTAIALICIVIAIYLALIGIFKYKNEAIDRKNKILAIEQILEENYSEKIHK